MARLAVLRIHSHGENGGLRHDLSAFTAYIQRRQSILQEGQVSSDVLIYYPIYDLWHNDQAKLPLFTVHNQSEWLWPTTFYKTSMELWNNGITFDYTSDKMLATASVRNHKSILAALASRGVLPETMTGLGLRFVRRSYPGGYHYFIMNRGRDVFDGVLPLAVSFRSALVLDPWSASHTGVVAPGFSLRLEPGQSVIIRTFTDRIIDGKPWVSAPTNPRVTAIAGPWKIQFLEGGPAIPAAAENIQVGSWTTLPGASNFAGTARYTTTFDFPASPHSSCLLDLGKVANTARVTLNGQDLGISWCAPHVVDVAKTLKTGENRLEIKVTNLAANRIADLDRREVKWKQFHEIYFVDTDYKTFDASKWPPINSGLLGPVRLLVK